MVWNDKRSLGSFYFIFTFSYCPDTYLGILAWEMGRKNTLGGRGRYKGRVGEQMT